MDKTDIVCLYICPAKRHVYVVFKNVFVTIVVLFD